MRRRPPLPIRAVAVVAATFALIAVVVAWPLLTVLNGAVFTLVLVVARTVVGRGVAFAVAAMVLAAVTVVVTDLSFSVLTPINFPPWDVDGDCQNTRQETLIRDLVDEQLTADGCNVVSGTLNDHSICTVMQFPRGRGTSDDA
jgi:hypothetical protein